MKPFTIRPFTQEELDTIQANLEADTYQPWPNDKVHEDLLDFPRRLAPFDPFAHDDDEFDGFSLIS